MGNLTLLQFRNNIETASQRQGVDPTFLNLLVNETVRELAYGIKFPEFEGSVSFNTVQSQPSYTFGTHISANDFRALHELGLRKTSPAESIGRLIPETREQYLLKIGDTAVADSEGMPKYYHRFGKKTIYLRPTPDSTVVAVLVHYWKSITPLAADQDVSPLTDDWDEAIRLGATARLLRDFGEHQRYQNIRNDFLQLVRSRVTDESLEQFPEGSLDIATSEEDLVSG